MALLSSARVLLAATTLSLLAACSASTDGAGDPAVTDDAELNESKSLGMTDVTILYPRPKNIDFLDDMLGPTSEGDRGELLPADVFAQLLPIASPPMFDVAGKASDPKRALFADFADSFSLLRVVGIRLDPCFGQSNDFASASCSNTIRLTAQFFTPRSVTGNNPTIDGRAAIHLFYEVSRADFTALAKAMLALRKTTGLPLQKGLLGTTDGVHPTLEAEGVRGPYATALKELILKFAGEQTLTQIAFAVEDRGTATTSYYGGGRPLNNRWVFGRHGYRNGVLQPLGIDSLDYVGLQSMDTLTNGSQRDAVIITPPSRTPDNFLQAFNMKREADGQLDPAKTEAARVAALKFQNPKTYATGAVDCASCHMAKLAAPNHNPDPLDFKSFTYRLDHTNDIIGPFRHFGYDGSGNPIVSARVVNETAVVLDYLNKNVMR